MTLDTALPPAVQELVDRAEIMDVYFRYARGVDRLDEELILSVFHEDAIDWHGDVKATPQDFLAKYLERPTRGISQHHIGNFTFDIDGDVAHCEAYYLMVGRLTDSSELMMSGGRYVDRFERRDGGPWKIAYRVLMREWRRTEPEWSGMPEFLTSGAPSLRNRDDHSYRRPLLPETV
jgi:ketosteroid isomerase-like protein